MASVFNYKAASLEIVLCEALIVRAMSRIGSPESRRIRALTLWPPVDTRA
jgi:hypothetical protein